MANEDIPLFCSCNFLEACTLDECRTVGDLRNLVLRMSTEAKKDYLKITYHSGSFLQYGS